MIADAQRDALVLSATAALANKDAWGPWLRCNDCAPDEGDIILLECSAATPGEAMRGYAMYTGIAYVVGEQAQLPGQRCLTWVNTTQHAADDGHAWKFGVKEGYGGMFRVIKPVSAPGAARRTSYGIVGVVCKRCNDLNPFAEPNQADGTYTCFGCR